MNESVLFLGWQQNGQDTSRPWSQPPTQFVFGAVQIIIMNNIKLMLARTDLSIEQIAETLQLISGISSISAL